MFVKLDSFQRYLLTPNQCAQYHQLLKPVDYYTENQILPNINRLTIAKLNIDDNPMTPSKYGVRGIPTLMVFKGGEVAGTKIGALPKGQLKEWVESVL